MTAYALDVQPVAWMYSECYVGGLGGPSPGASSDPIADLPFAGRMPLMFEADGQVPILDLAMRVHPRLPNLPGADALMRHDSWQPPKETRPWRRGARPR